LRSCGLPQAGIEVVYTVVESLTGRPRPSLDHKLSASWFPGRLEDSDHAVGPRDDEIILRKTSSGVLTRPTSITCCAISACVSLVVGLLTTMRGYGVRDGATGVLHDLHFRLLQHLHGEGRPTRSSIRRLSRTVTARGHSADCRSAKTTVLG